jgi:two-component system, NtrC family, response regulator HydG
MTRHPPTRVLVTDDDDSFRRVLVEILAAHGYAATGARNGEEALALLQEEWIDLLISDVRMPGIKGHEMIARIRAEVPEVPIVAMTAFGSVEDALSLTRSGAAEYLTKPFRTDRLLQTVEEVLEGSSLQRERARARRTFGVHLDGVIGVSPVMQRLFERITRVAPSGAPVLITGETGTGKEVIARAVHQASGRRKLVPVNCGAIPANLIESEFFGHVRGAFTGADRDKQGLFEEADGGTLFLDELGELPVGLQPKLLRVLESGELRRVGDLKPRRVDVRIIAATNRDLPTEVGAGRFREDLFWRLNVLTLGVPPLRERVADIRPLVLHYAASKCGRTGRRVPDFSPEVWTALERAAWPGNVRELFACVEQILTFSCGSPVGPEHLPDAIQHVGGRRDSLIRGAADQLLTLEQVERAYIREVLKQTGGNKARAAKILGIPRRTLYRRLAAFGGSCPTDAESLTLRPPIFDAPARSAHGALMSDIAVAT